MSLTKNKVIMLLTFEWSPIFSILPSPNGQKWINKMDRLLSGTKWINKMDRLYQVPGESGNMAFSQCGTDKD